MALQLGMKDCHLIIVFEMFFKLRLVLSFISSMVIGSLDEAAVYLSDSLFVFTMPIKLSSSCCQLVVNIICNEWGGAGGGGDKWSSFRQNSSSCINF